MGCDSLSIRVLVLLGIVVTTYEMNVIQEGCTWARKGGGFDER